MTTGNVVISAGHGESRVLRAACVIGIAALVLMLILLPPKKPVDMLAMLGGVALLGVLPRLPGVTGLAGLPLCLAATWPAGYMPKDIGVAMVLFCLFIAIGYAWPAWVGAVAAAVYALTESACTVWLGARGAAACCVRALLRLWLATETDDGAGQTAITTAEPGIWPVFVAGVLISVIVSGFAVILGYAFSARAETSSQLARTQVMLGRLTREQELAHMIHDSVANDASVIAMLAWRAKTALQGSGNTSTSTVTAMLDAIYDRAHQALDRTHEVIDVLNGTRTIDGAAIDGAATGRAPVADDSPGSVRLSGPSSSADLNDSPGPVSSSDPVGSFAASGTLDGRLERLCEDQDRMLHMLGFTGSGRVEGAGPDHVPARTRRAVTELVQEIYANIVRHGMPGDDGFYAVFVALDDDSARITSTNRIADGAGEVSEVRHGRGLGLHRAAVAALGGTVSTAVQDGTWVLNAVIPLR